MRVFILAAMALVGVTQMAAAQDNSAQAVAAAILTGYRQTNPELIAPHFNATNERYFASNANGSESADALGDVTGGAAWDGMIVPAR